MNLQTGKKRRDFTHISERERYAIETMLKWARENKAECLKDNPETDVEYWDNEIEKHLTAIEKLEKIAELLLKQM